MAVIWKKVVNGQSHEVRTAGSSLRLYTDDVFHSQYNPNKPVGSNLWDLLLLPSFYIPKEGVNQVLVLGVGGGTILRQLNHFYPSCHITGIDINKTHLQVARQFFGVKGKHYSLIHDDAIKWLRKYQGEPFDYIIEDLYGEEEGEPVRAIEPTAGWMKLLGKNLTKDGVLVMNYTTFRELKSSAWFTSPVIQRRFPHAARLNMSQYDNVMGVFSRRHLMRSKLMAGIDQMTVDKERRALARLDYTLRLLKHV